MMNPLAGLKMPPLIEEPTSPTAAADTKAKGLLVEDDGIGSQDLYETINRLGYEVVGIAAEGFDAVRMVDERSPELVVMDVELRGRVDGIEAARMIQRRSHVPVIFLTGHRDAHTLERAVQTG